MSNTKVTTGEVRFSFPHVFQPHANNPGQEEKYSVTILIPKTDTATINAIQAAMQAAAQEGVSTKFNGQMPAMLLFSGYRPDVYRIPVQVSAFHLASG